VGQPKHPLQETIQLHPKHKFSFSLGQEESIYSKKEELKLGKKEREREKCLALKIPPYPIIIILLSVT
jgi:hypothetical protein